MNNPTSQRSQCPGIVLPALLLYVTVLSVIVLSTFYLCHETVLRRGARLHADMARAASIGASINQHATSKPWNDGTAIHQTTRIETKGLHTIERGLLSIHFEPDMAVLSLPVIDGRNISNSKFPRFNYAAILGNPDYICTTELDGVISHTLSGFVLTPGSNYSLTICGDSIADIADKYVIAGNYMRLSDTNIPAQFSRFLLAASGYIDIDATLSLNGETLIIAAGDLHLRSLRNEGAAAPAVTLISASGVVQIESIYGEVRLKLIAPQGVFLPIEPLKEDNGLLPPVLQRVTIGFTEGRD